MNTSKVSLFESSTPVVMELSQGLTETQPAGESHSVAAAERKQQDLKASCLHPSPTEPCLWLDSQAALKAEPKGAGSSVQRCCHSRSRDPP